MLIEYHFFINSYYIYAPFRKNGSKIPSSAYPKSINAILVRKIPTIN
ncbi:hypothetical protein B488_03890 [Liberibacter crescens BT-1]|uniref:Uncharacterized protein n=1 Tax=Liberibacter crescens (strain BT-1) TaxID=1215343 RepID=L0EVF6_LIBCB|nr:hypothetical protein B488_03890 [Liberibacter crescens BT-1]